MTTQTVSTPDFSVYEHVVSGVETVDDDALADTIVSVQDAIAYLRVLELDLTAALGRRRGPCTGNATDGRQYTLRRSPDRKDWDHAEWKRDVRRVLVQNIMDGAALSVVNEETGTTEPLAPLLHTVLTDAQEIHGSTAPRSGALKRISLYATDYCTSSPGGWRLSTIRAEVPQAVQS